jgi:regulator of sirC expression with transglutaminase-like and TPR domain
MDLDETLAGLAESPAADVDLAEVALHIACDEYGKLDVAGYLSELDVMARDARRFLGKGLDGQVAGLCRYLFHEAGFHGNQNHYYDPRNSYLNEVLDRQTGIPITLSVVAMAVGRRAGLPVEGVALPGHFIAMVRSNDERILFDPYHDGKLLEPSDCVELARRAAGEEVEVSEEMLRPAAPGIIVTRMLTNLKGCYLRKGDFRRAVRTIQRIIQITPEDLSQRRDLGVCCVQAGQPGKAIDHLAAYLNGEPEAGDMEAVEKLLEQARAEVAKWN